MFDLLVHNAMVLDGRTGMKVMKRDGRISKCKERKEYSPRLQRSDRQRIPLHNVQSSGDSCRRPSYEVPNEEAGSLNFSFIKMIWSRSEKNDMRLNCVIGASPGCAP